MDALYDAMSHSQIRESDIDLVATNSEAADPGKFKGEVARMLGKIICELLVRHSWRQQNPVIICCAREQNPIGRRGICVVYRTHDFLQGKNTESWIRAIAKHQDGRRDMTALRRHYAGKGNSTYRIVDAKKIQTTHHYKSERALPFNKFLDTLQRMFTIFIEENKPLTECAKVDNLLTKVQNYGLAAVVEQLRYQLNITGITFTVAANHLNFIISQTPDYQLLRKIIAVNIHTTTGGSGCGYGRGRGGRGCGGGRGRGNRGGRGESQKTAYYSKEEWDKLSYEKNVIGRESKGDET